MPLYKLHCRNCNHVYEDMLRISDTDRLNTIACPNCKFVGGLKIGFSANHQIVIPSNLGYKETIFHTGESRKS